MDKLNAIQEKFDGTVIDELSHMPEVSVYNSNYYHLNKYLLFGYSDDDNTTDWWLIRYEYKPMYLGYSMCSDDPECIIAMSEL